MQYVGVDSNSASKPRELAKMMHRNIIEQHLKHHYLESMQIIQHIASTRISRITFQFGIDLFDDFYKKSAWPENCKDI